MICLFSKLDFQSMSGIVSFSPGDEIWVLPACCMVCDARNEAEWNHRFSPEGKGRAPLDAVLNRLGAVHIHYWNYYEPLTPETLRRIAGSSWIILPGGLMELGLARLRESGLDQVLLSFQGHIAANSAGALLLFDRYMVSPNAYYPAFSIEPGLGRIRPDFFLEVHYAPGCPEQEKSIRNAQRQRGKVYALYENGALVMEEGRVKRTRNCRIFFDGGEKDFEDRSGHVQ